MSSKRTRARRRESHLLDGTVTRRKQVPVPSLINPPSDTIKIVVVGESGSGKSNLIQRLVHDQFDERSPSTIGIDFSLFEFRIEELNLSSPLLRRASDQTYCAQIWDTAGMERYRSSITNIFYRDVLGAMLVFDLTNRHHFEALPRWLAEIRTNVHHSDDDNDAPIPVVLVGNKLDLADHQRQVDRTQALQFVHNNGLFGYVETSAKTRVNVPEAFHRLFRAIIEPAAANGLTVTPPVQRHKSRASIRLAKPKESKKTKKCSC